MASKKPGESLKSLRERAETVLQASSAETPTMSTTDVQALVQELNVHRIELEVQNEELRQAQIQLAEERDRFSDLYEYAPVGYLTLTIEGRILEANLAAASLLGVERRELLRANITKYVAPDSQDDYYRHRQALASGTGRHTCELVTQRKEGPPRILRLESVANDSDAGRRTRTALVDITEHKRIEAALQTSEELLRTVLNTAADAIITINDRGIVRSFNRAAERMFGYDAAEVTGQNVNILMPSPYREEHDEYLQRYAATGEPHVIGIGREVAGRRKDGTVFPLDVIISEVDHLHIFTGILRDLTRRKQLEQEVLEIASLEQQRIGQDLHDSIGQQLTGLVMLAQVLGDSIRSASLPGAESGEAGWESGLADPAADLPQWSAHADRLRDGIERSLGDVRSICRDLTPVPIDEHGLATALEQLVEETANRSTVACSFHCPTPVTITDRLTAAHLFNIAQGAFGNALRHSEADAIEVRLEQSDGQIILSVRDNGVGIPSSPRTGLGLRIMQNRARIIGGMLAVRRLQPTGTEVACILPPPTPQTFGGDRERTVDRGRSPCSARPP
jgi:PAS domain S-box-containing protein